ncbi:MAG: hypothetical protein KJ607_03180 [Bacteroidetes bacterium]|nr:hypothetical protein [Bacteroidota bacterium]
MKKITNVFLIILATSVFVQVAGQVTGSSDVAAATDSTESYPLIAYIACAIGGAVLHIVKKLANDEEKAKRKINFRKWFAGNVFRTILSIGLAVGGILLIWGNSTLTFEVAIMTGFTSQSLTKF